MKLFRVLMVHNYYQHPGGEDTVFSAEKELLSGRGHEVMVLSDTNLRLNQISNFRVAKNAVWSNETINKIERLIDNNHPDIAHVHNTWMMLSPSIYYAFQKANIPVVQTLHNYRLLCPNALLFRKNKVCEDCMRFPIPIPGILHKCYRGSIAQSALMTAMLTYHRVIHTWRNQINCYIALSDFSRNKFIQGGLQSDKLFVKPNFIEYSTQNHDLDRKYAFFSGRLSIEKGVRIFADAWRSHVPSNIQLRIAGEGPEHGLVNQLVSQKDNVRYLGFLNKESLTETFWHSKFVIIPSVCYESFPITILEAFVTCTPVIASRIGALAELIRDGETGLLFNPGDPVDLAEKVDWLWNHPEESARMGRNARKEYEAKYTPERNYQMLMEIYEMAMTGRK
ncbi:MAG: glycosyltransferase family 4 protein [Anaerolineales bacterium]|jgi:glycosyltransferase involved in cell wall biosynthesis